MNVPGAGGITGVLPDLQRLQSGYRLAATESTQVAQWFRLDALWGSIGSLALAHSLRRCPMAATNLSASGA